MTKRVLKLDLLSNHNKFKDSELDRNSANAMNEDEDSFTLQHFMDISNV